MKTKQFWNILTAYLACLSLLTVFPATARGATDAGALTEVERLTPPWNDNWPYDRVEFFPLIRKGDIKGGYPYQRGEVTGQAGTPLYTFTEDGELDEAFMITLADNGSGSRLWDDKLWQGSLRKFKYNQSAETRLAAEADAGVLKWDLAKKLKSVAIGSEPQSRNLRYWFGQSSDMSRLDASLHGDGTIFTENAALYPEANGYYSRYLGLGAERLVGSAAAYRWHSSRMLLGWTIGRDYRIQTDGESVSLVSGARTMLPDMGQGAMALLQRTSNIPGASQKRDRRLLFVQSNEGILHAVDADSAEELLAFVPPNVAGRARAAFQKLDGTRVMTEGSGTGKTNWLAFGRWLDSSGSGTTKPSFLTDGSLLVRDVVLPTMTEDGNFGTYPLKSSYAANEWETLVLGTSGRGGAGIYALRMANVAGSSAAERFSFGWAVENNLYSFVVNQGHPVKGETVYWSPAAGDTGSGRTISYSATASDSEYAGGDDGPFSYWRLGWNAPEPVLGTMLLPGGKATNLLVATGGYQYFVDTSSTGDVGATIYLIDPFSGRILLRRDPRGGYYHRQDVVNADSPGLFQGRIATSMGMMLTPPTPVTFDGTKVKSSYNGEFLRSVFTADHRGNIFEVSFVDEDHGGAALKLSPRSAADLFSVKGSTNENPRWLATLIDTGASGARGDVKNLIPYRFAVAQGDDGFGKDIWLAGGTADTPTVDMTRSQNGTTKASGELKNKRQYIFGFRRRDPGESVEYHGTPIVSIPRYGASLDQYANRDAMPVDHRTDPFLMEAWYIGLETNEWGEPVEYVSAAPYVFEGELLYVATYLPGEGNSRLYYLDPRSGKGLWNRTNGPKYYTLYGAHVRGFSQANLTGGSGRLEPKILVSYTGVLQEKVTKSGETVSDIKADLGASILTSNAGDAEVFSMTPDPNVGRENKSGERIYYWRRYRVH